MKVQILSNPPQTIEFSALYEWLDKQDKQDHCLFDIFLDGMDVTVDTHGAVRDRGQFYAEDILVPVLWHGIATSNSGYGEETISTADTWSAVVDFRGEGQYEGIPYSLIRDRLWDIVCFTQDPDGFVHVNGPIPEFEGDFEGWVEALRREADWQEEE